MNTITQINITYWWNHFLIDGLNLMKLASTSCCCGEWSTGYNGFELNIKYFVWADRYSSSPSALWWKNLVSHIWLCSPFIFLCLSVSALSRYPLSSPPTLVCDLSTWNSWGVSAKWSTSSQSLPRQIHSPWRRETSSKRRQDLSVVVFMWITFFLVLSHSVHIYDPEISSLCLPSSCLQFFHACGMLHGAQMSSCYLFLA